MKIKGISFFEQHVEKFAAGAAGLVLIAVVAAQFIISPNRVSMNGKDVDPADIEPQLKQKMESVRSRLQGGGGTGLPPGPLPKSFEEFKEAVDGSISPRPEIPAVEPALLAALVPGDVSLGERPYHEPKFAAPTMVRVQQEWATLEDTALTQFKDLADHFTGKPAPYDIVFTTPVSQFSSKAMRDELRKSNLNAKPSVLAVPPIWFNDTLYVVDLVFERQERRADGSWSDPEVVSTLPGQDNFRARILKIDPALKDEVLPELAKPARVRAMLQPDFLPTKGSFFSAASILGATDQAKANDAESEAVARLRRELRRATDQAAQLKLDLDVRGGPLEGDDAKKDKNKDKDKGSGGGGNGGGAAPPGPGGGFGSGSGGQKNNQGAGQSDEEKKARIRLTKRWHDAEDKVAKLTAELTKLAPEAVVGATANTAKLLDLSKDDSVFVWAHDIDVQPGSTYRYRSHLEVFNPFYARKRQLVKNQQELAESFVTKTKVSDWSEAITVQPPVAFFVTSASANPSSGDLGLGSARVEVYRFHDGQRHLESPTVQPGDRIGGLLEHGNSSPSVDYTTDWYCVAIVADASAGSDQNSAQVVVRRIGDSELKIRSPREDLKDDERSRFSEEVTAARLAIKDAKEEKDREAARDRRRDSDNDKGAGGGSGTGGGGRSPGN